MCSARMEAGRCCQPCWTRVGWLTRAAQGLYRNVCITNLLARKFTLSPVGLLPAGNESGLIVPAALAHELGYTTEVRRSPAGTVPFHMP